MQRKSRPGFSKQSFKIKQYADETKIKGKHIASHCDEKEELVLTRAIG